MSYHLNNGVPLQLDGNDTAPPPLPPWLKGFLVTSKKREDVAAAGREIANLCNDLFFKLAYDDLGVPASMGQARGDRGPLRFRRALAHPGVPRQRVRRAQARQQHRQRSHDRRRCADGPGTPRVSRDLLFSPNRRLLHAQHS